MPHAVWLLTRITRATVALTTAWCLGCCAFEPLLNGLFGAAQGAGMVCAADEGASTTVVPGANAGNAAAVVAAPTEAGAPDATGCACLSCYAPHPVASTLTVATSRIERQPTLDPTTLLSVSREPLVPPPQPVL